MSSSPSRPYSSLPIPLALTVIYDDRCQLCQRCRAWLAGSAQLVPIGFVAASDRSGVHRLGLDPAVLPVGDDLIVVGHTTPDEPEPVWVGPDAFITCLWALTEHRSLAARLQKPTMRPLAKRAFHALSLSRGSISSVLAAAGRGIEDPIESLCADDGCSQPSASGIASPTGTL